MGAIKYTSSFLNFLYFSNIWKIIALTRLNIETAKQIKADCGIGKIVEVILNATTIFKNILESGRMQRFALLVLLGKTK